MVLVLAARRSAPTPSPTGGCSADRAFSYATVNGYRYRFWSRMRVTSGGTTGLSQVETADGSCDPIGYMGARSLLFRCDGALVACSGWIYSRTAAAGLYVPSKVEGPGEHFEQGWVRLFNGFGYNSYRTRRYPAPSHAVGVSWGINRYGETYGSYASSSWPELVAAVGKGGTLGYVRSDLLDSGYVPTNPDEAVMRTLSLPCFWEVPLTDREGRREVDTFLVSSGVSQAVEMGG